MMPYNKLKILYLKEMIVCKKREYECINVLMY